ncbi:hypothetical protein [Vibrio europaeus]|uniref:hypothetical protein n=1 Tax=Vibrio europaeus TaxID=300876 RepID=UPI00233EFDCB|nr:hypothetical protein [Vibrio europaeus]MDC5753536.1 hypothetical protein [Vibrio europaeus]MDC5816551.1 hypothetical protein [Vibrio europaeus]
MSKNIGVLATVTETFNIFNDGRKHNTAPQSYVLSAVKSLVASGKTKERIELGEAIGFYGHTIREKTKKLKPNEKEWIIVDGESVEVRVQPAVRCTYFDCDDMGNVTHTEEFLDTDDGKAAYAAYKAKNGGFSWALGGINGTGKGFASVPREFAGFDYVFQPNFIPQERRELLLASTQENSEEMLLSSMKDEGLEQAQAESMVKLYARNGYHEFAVDDLIMADMIEKSEKLQAESENREMLLSQVLDNCPYVLSNEQKEALINVSTQEQAETVASIFSSMAQTDLGDLPPGFQVTEKPVPSTVKIDEIPVLGGRKVQFS